MITKLCEIISSVGKKDKKWTLTELQSCGRARRGGRDCSANETGVVLPEHPSLLPFSQVESLTATYSRRTRECNTFFWSPWIVYTHGTHTQTHTDTGIHINFEN